MCFSTLGGQHMDLLSGQGCPVGLRWPCVPSWGGLVCHHGTYSYTVILSVPSHVGYATPTAPLLLSLNVWKVSIIYCENLRLTVIFLHHFNDTNLLSIAANEKYSVRLCLTNYSHNLPFPSDRFWDYFFILDILSIVLFLFILPGHFEDWCFISFFSLEKFLLLLFQMLCLHKLKKIIYNSYEDLLYP